MNEPLLLRFGKKHLVDPPDVKGLLREFVYDFICDDDFLINDFVQNTLGIVSKQSEKHSEKHSEIVIVRKTISTSGLKWHLDDCQLVTMRTPPIYNQEHHVKLEFETDKYLYTSSGKTPRYTVLFYSSTWGVDFEGGELLLADGTRIRPVKNHGLVLHGSEVHMVTPVKSGTRNVTLAKVY